LLLMGVLSAAAGESVEAKSKTLFLIVDYLPAAVYAGDEIAVNVRVENSSKAAMDAELTLEGTRRDGANSSPRTQKVQCAAGGFASASFSVASAEMTAFALKLNSAGETVAKLNVDVLHDDEPWPKTVVRGGVIEKETAAGERLIWVPTRREKKVDRAFLPMKWLLGADEKKKGAADEKARVQPVAFLPSGYSDGKSEALGPYRLDGNAPVLHAARTILDSVSAPALVIGLPPEDIEAATDPRLFRVVLDGLLTRLKSGGAQRVAVLPPFKYGISDERMKGFWKETADACVAHQAQYIDPSPFLNESYWRADPAQAGVYAAQPNSTGRAQLGEYLKELGVGVGVK